MYRLKCVLGPGAPSSMGNLEGEGFPPGQEEKGRLTCSHGLQRTLAKPPRLHPLDAATRKGEQSGGANCVCCL